jgi:uncharacterized protein with von Willebrand factor type A (vWA) domain
VREGNLSEVDIDATVSQITRQGFFDNVVMRPVMQRRAELVVLVDDHEGMIPLRVAIATHLARRMIELDRFDATMLRSRELGGVLV